MNNKVLFKNKLINWVANHIKQIKGGYFGRQRFFITTIIYRFLPYFNLDYSRLIEWHFVLSNLPKGGRVLDIGSTSSLFIYELAARGYEVFSIDPRPYQEKLPPSVKFIQGDLLKNSFPGNFFHNLIAISVIEHTGIGFYGDIEHNDGDFIVMRELYRILKSGGVVFLTTYIGNKFVIDISERLYNQDRFKKLIGNFTITREEYYIFRKRWIRTSKEKAFSEPPERRGLVCIMLGKPSTCVETQ